MTFAPRHVLVPIDPGTEPEFRDALADKACDLARQVGAKVTFFAAVPIPIMAAGLEAPGDVAKLVYDVQEAGSAHAHKVLTAIIESAAAEGVECEQVVDTMCTSIPDAVVAAAHKAEADLLVLNTHGRKGLSRLLLGSVAERVAREAPCEVLLLRPETLAA
jgi:nucleotide-binding universal stress UspA family protein